MPVQQHQYESIYNELFECQLHGRRKFRYVALPTLMGSTHVGKVLNQVSATQCSKSRNSRQPLVIDVVSAATALVVVVITLRVWARVRGNGMDIEDWVHVAAGVSSLQMMQQ